MFFFTYENVGKSTVLRLIARIHDPEEGDIFIDGRNIRNLKVADLRRAISVLFQDYTHFPLSVSLSGTKLRLYLNFVETQRSRRILASVTLRMPMMKTRFVKPPDWVVQKNSSTVFPTALRLS
jgi:ABC-type proline/glycine betaine transport system ATPase subunit